MTNNEMRTKALELINQNIKKYNEGDIVRAMSRAFGQIRMALELELITTDEALELQDKFC